jgi:hypothetical protein
VRRNRSEYNKRWAKEHRKERREYMRVLGHRPDQREKHYARMKDYRVTDTYRAKNVAYQSARRARENGAAGKYTDADILEVWKAQNFRCFYCGARR